MSNANQVIAWRVENKTMYLYPFIHKNILQACKLEAAAAMCCAILLPFHRACINKITKCFNHLFTCDFLCLNISLKNIGKKQV